MMLRHAARRFLLQRPTAGFASSSRSMSLTPASASAAVSDEGGVIPSYVATAPVATITTLDNGVTIATMFDAAADTAASPPPPLSRVSTRLSSSVGSRSDVVGGESALFAASLLGGGVVGREHVSLSGMPSLPAGLSSGELDVLKAQLAAKIGSSSSYESQMMDNLHSTAFQGQSLGNFLEGTVESVDAISMGDVEALAGGIVGSDVVVVGTGGGGGGGSSSSSHERLVEEAERVYGNLAGGGGSGREVKVIAGEKSAFIGSDVRIKYDSHSTATIAIGFEGASHSDPKVMPLALMATILGSYSKSDGLGKNVAPAMSQEVADHGLASSISAFSLNHSDTGLFGVVATAPDNRLDDLMWYVMPNMVRLAHGVSDEEMARAKLALRASVLSRYDGDVALAETMAGQVATIGRFVPAAEMLARVDALTMDDVKAAADAVINDQDHALAAIGGIHELPDYNWIRRHSYMLRY